MRSERDRWLRSALSGRAFDDFLNPPGWGRVKTRKGISLAAKFSQNIRLNIPIVSANMDTITRARMAVAVAKEGGIGIIERYLSIEEQCNKAREVKREENYIIGLPYSVMPYGDNIAGARKIMADKKVGCLVVLDDDRSDNKKLAGLLTCRDVRFADGNEPVARRMTPKEKLERYPLANKDKNGQLYVGAAIGAVGDFLERSSELVKAGVDVLVMDIANFQSDLGKEAVRKFRRKFTDTELVVGNVVLPEAVEVYQRLGVNGINSV